jgi:hypothetical protein
MVKESRPRGGEFMTNWKLSPDAKHRLLVSTAMLGALCTGYGRRAYAACVSGPTGTYACSGALTTTQFLPSPPNSLALTVTSDATFSVIVTSGDALDLSSTQGISFTDLTGGAISGATNPPDANNGIGINANQSGGSGNLTISTGSSVAISGGDYAVNVHNSGTGTVTISTLGTVTSSHLGGMEASNTAGLGGMSITTASVTGFPAASTHPISKARCRSTRPPER